MVKGIIFDLDGTLVDCMPDFCEMMNLFLEKIGAKNIKNEVTPEKVKTFIGHGAREAMERLLNHYDIPFTDKEADELFKIYMRVYNTKPLDKSTLCDNVFDTLVKLKKEGYKMAICTNKPHKPAMFVLEQLGIKDFFSPILDAEATPHLKPSPEIMNIVLEKMKLKKEDCIMVGDSKVDVDAAKSVNMPVIIVSYGFAYYPVQSLNADKIIDNFGELVEAVKHF